MVFKLFSLIFMSIEAGIVKIFQLSLYILQFEMKIKKVTGIIYWRFDTHSEVLGSETLKTYTRYSVA